MSSDEINPGSGTAYCVSCGEEIPVNINFCPECGSEQNIGKVKSGHFDSSTSEEGGSRLRDEFPGINEKNTTRRNALTGIVYALGGVTVFGAVVGGEGADSSGGSRGTNGGGGSSNGEEKYPNAWAYDENTGIVLRNVQGSVGEFSTNITGEAINESDQDYGYVQLTFSLFDSSDAKIGDALANTNGLVAGQQWLFEAIGTISRESIDTLRLSGITAY